MHRVGSSRACGRPEAGGFVFRFAFRQVLDIIPLLKGTVGEHHGSPDDAPRLIDVTETVIRSSQEVVVGSVLPIPPDYHALRALNKDLASMWRAAMSSALHDVFESGHSIAGVGDQGYVVGVRSGTVR